MDIQKELLLWVGAALVCAMVVSFIMCPLVKSFAYKIGAIDVPKDSRRMHIFSSSCNFFSNPLF